MKHNQNIMVNTMFILNTDMERFIVGFVSGIEEKAPTPLPGMLAGDSCPVRGVLALAGEPAGDGDGPRIPGRWGDV